MNYRRLLALPFAVLLCCSTASFGAGWGTVKGTVVWKGALPAVKNAVVDTDPKECLKNGPVPNEEYVIDKNTKGVKWVMVWLAPEKDGDVLPVHPSLKEPASKTVKLEQPCCQFIPHVLGIREGQTLQVTNGAAVPHNIKIDGGSKNPNLNQSIPPGGDLKVDDWKASRNVVPFACNVHKWMGGKLWVFNHPYFTVTNDKGEFEIKNAPAGKFRIVVWQEGQGWVAGEKGEKPTRAGKMIEIPEGKARSTSSLRWRRRSCNYNCLAASR